MRWVAGADHAGFELKAALVAALREAGDEVDDLGTSSADSVDYPDFARVVAARVAEGGCLGLLVCGTGNGMAMAANKVVGVRAALVTDELTARMARAHNDANVVALGARVVSEQTARAALMAFRDTEFEGGRHQRRVDKIRQLERSTE